MEHSKVIGSEGIGVAGSLALKVKLGVGSLVRPGPPMTLTSGAVESSM